MTSGRLIVASVVYLNAIQMVPSMFAFPVFDWLWANRHEMLAETRIT